MMVIKKAGAILTRLPSPASISTRKRRPFQKEKRRRAACYKRIQKGETVKLELEDEERVE